MSEERGDAQLTTAAGSAAIRVVLRTYVTAFGKTPEFERVTRNLPAGRLSTTAGPTWAVLQSRPIAPDAATSVD